METIYEKNLKYMLNKLKVIAIINISIKPAYISLTKVLGVQKHMAKRKEFDFMY